MRLEVILPDNSKNLLDALRERTQAPGYAEVIMEAIRLYAASIPLEINHESLRSYSRQWWST